MDSELALNDCQHNSIAIDAPLYILHPMNTKTNFANIIAELVANGTSYALIADKCDCSEAYIKQLASGTRGIKGPNYDIGVRIMDMHDKNKGRQK